MAPITVAIAGATGESGIPISKAFLSPTYHPSKVARLLAITRDPNSAASKELESAGAELVVVPGKIDASHLKGVDVLVECLGHFVAVDIKNDYVRAAAEAGVKVFFLSEYGVDHRTIPVKHEMWEDNKKPHENLARTINGGSLKVISLYTGMFLEVVLIPPFGFDTANRLYTAPGLASTRFTLNSEHDIASSIVRLSVLAAEGRNSVPDYVRISGDSKSWAEIADIFGKALGVKIDTKDGDIDAYREMLDKEAGGKGRALDYLNLLMGTGVVDFSKDNENELVNPGESLWRWRKVEDYAEEQAAKA